MDVKLYKVIIKYSGNGEEVINHHAFKDDEDELSFRRSLNGNSHIMQKIEINTVKDVTKLEGLSLRDLKVLMNTLDV